MQDFEGQAGTGAYWKIYEGHALNVLQHLSIDDKFNCVVTSPPYFWLRDYQDDAQIGLETTIDEYIEAIASIMDETYKRLADNGLLFLNLGDTYYSGKGKSHGTDRKSS